MGCHHLQNASAEADQSEAAGGWLKVDLNTSRGPDSGRGGFSGGRGRGGRFDGGRGGGRGRDGETLLLCALSVALQCFAIAFPSLQAVN